MRSRTGDLCLYDRFNVLINKVGLWSLSNRPNYRNLRWLMPPPQEKQCLCLIFLDFHDRQDKNQTMA